MSARHLRLAILLLTVVFFACDRSEPVQQASSGAPTPLPAIKIVAETVVKEAVFEGVIEAVNQSTVSAQTAGRVAELPFDVGDYVPKGAVIVRLAGKQPQARYQQAIARMQESRTAYEETELQLQRAKPLYEKKVLSDADMDRIKLTHGQAKARYESAAAAVAEAEANLDYTTVRAPYAGVVTERHVQIGEAVQPGVALMSGIALEELRAEVDVPQSLLNVLSSHRKARLIFPDNRSLESEMLTIFPYADSQTHTVKVRVNLPDAKQAIYPGMLVKVAFVTDRDLQLLIPYQALVHRSEVTGVYLQNKSGITFRQIRVGDRLPGDRVPVLAGLSADELLILDPVAALAQLKRAPQALVTDSKNEN